MSNELCNIHRFQERDIDLILAEELRVNKFFATWFVKTVSDGVKVEVPAVRTRISVVEDGSESDVVACFRRVDGGLHRIYIEDKITAKMMPEQLERYQRRAKAEHVRGESQSYSVVLFAPRNYQTKVPAFVTCVSFEDAAEALNSVIEDPRAAYKASFLLAALPHYSAKLRDQKIAEVEPYVVEWWDAVYEMLDREFPGFFLPAGTRYPRSVYFAPRMSGMAEYLRVDFKGHSGEVDLAFKGINYTDLSNALDGLDLTGKLVENDKSTSIRIDGLKKFVVADGLDIIETDVRAAFAATKTLLMFWKNHRDRFDSLSI